MSSDVSIRGGWGAIGIELIFADDLQLTLGRFLPWLLVPDCSFRTKSMPSAEIASYKATRQELFPTTPFLASDGHLINA